MYVCQCMRVRERALRRAVRAGAVTPAAVGQACGAGTRCGRCHDRITEIIAETARDEQTTASGWRRLARRLRRE